MTSRAGTDYKKLRNEYSSTNVRNDRTVPGTDLAVKPVVTFRMLARNAADSAYVRWNVQGTPDWAGAYAGVPILAGSAVVI
jgi:hypothetical protein